MSDEILKPGTQKRVNVFASIPVSMPHGLGEIGFSRTAPISGRQMGVMLPIEVIRICILGRAQVDECLANGGLLRLTLANYNKDNNVVKDTRPQPVVVTPLQVKNGRIVPPPVQKRKNKATNLGGVNVHQIVKNQEYHLPPSNDPFSDVKQTGPSTDGSADAQTVENGSSTASEVVASEVQSVVNEPAKEEAPAQEVQEQQQQTTGKTDEEVREVTKPIANDPMLQMVAEAEQDEEEEQTTEENATPQQGNSKKKKKKR